MADPAPSAAPEAPPASDKPNDPPADPPAASPPSASDSTKETDLTDRLTAQGRELAEARKALADLQEQIADEKRTDEEKAAKALGDSQRERDEAIAERDRLRRENAMLKVASAKGADAELAIALLEQDPGRYGITIEDGKVEGVEAAMDKLIEEKPAVKAGAPSGRFAEETNDAAGPRGSSTPGQLTRADLKSMSPEAITAARREGRLDDLLSGRQAS